MLHQNRVHPIDGLYKDTKLMRLNPDMQQKPMVSHSYLFSKSIHHPKVVEWLLLAYHDKKSTKRNLLVKEYFLMMHQTLMRIRGIMI